MDIQSQIRNDRSGVGTLIVVIIIVIVVVAAAAAYVVLSGEEDEYEEETIAPGTWRAYNFTVDGVERGEIDLMIIGQNEKEYFVMATIDGETPIIQYAVHSKGAPKGVEVKATEVLETFEGPKTLTVWEYTLDSTIGPQSVRSYVDPVNEMSYRDEITFTDPTSSSGGKSVEVRTLKDYELVFQKSYQESEAIGMTFEYALTVGALSFPVSIVCIADCLEGHYGMMYDVTSIFGLQLYFLSDGIHGLPANATSTKVTAILSGTIDGDVPVEIWWVYDYGALFTFYCEQSTQLIYGFVVTVGETDYAFELLNKP